LALEGRSIGSTGRGIKKLLRKKGHNREEKNPGEKEENEASSRRWEETSEEGVKKERARNLPLEVVESGGIEKGLI